MKGWETRLDTRDVDLARAQVARSYCPHSLSPTGGAFRARHAEAGVGDLGVFSLSYGEAQVRVHPDPFGDFVLFSRPLAGGLTVRGTAGETYVEPGRTVALDSRTAHDLAFGAGCRLLTIKLPTTLVGRAGAAGGRAGDIRSGLALDPRPWDAVMRLLLADVVPNGLLGTPFGASVTQLAAAAALDSFGVEPEPARRSSPAAADVVRRACEFVDGNADGAIGLLDIAAAAGVAPRTVQDHFRERLGTRQQPARRGAAALPRPVRAAGRGQRRRHRRDAVPDLA
ncbi:AraC family transcriptional regulator [Pseudonocardia sp. N23]|uniref:cupin domain-containing protein n=1 Tax=Pseudonocardia sp. N23 TaxID=1987376 RepID=UPI000BFDAF40|nr:AraC family transcriptional regulator [Pseudonocardia sp. N23]GAY07263.1 transcriptional regulator, AraC family [Pseudonocardia sp. N23]